MLSLSSIEWSWQSVCTFDFNWLSVCFLFFRWRYMSQRDPHVVGDDVCLSSWLSCPSQGRRYRLLSLLWCNRWVEFVLVFVLRCLRGLSWAVCHFLSCQVVFTSPPLEHFAHRSYSRSPPIWFHLLIKSVRSWKLRSDARWRYHVIIYRATNCRISVESRIPPNPRPSWLFVGLLAMTFISHRSRTAGTTCLSWRKRSPNATSRWQLTDQPRWLILPDSWLETPTRIRGPIRCVLCMSQWDTLSLRILVPFFYFVFLFCWFDFVESEYNCILVTCLGLLGFLWFPNLSGQAQVVFWLIRGLMVDAFIVLKNGHLGRWNK